MMRAIWFTSGGCALILGLIGIPLPGLPTVPFLLLAAFCFARSSTTVHDWLVNHPRLGQPIQDWRDSGAIRPAAKRLATLAIAVTFGISLFLGIKPWALALQALVLTGVLFFIWTRPNGSG